MVRFTKPSGKAPLGTVWKRAGKGTLSLASTNNINSQGALPVEHVGKLKLLPKLTEEWKHTFQ